MNILTRVCDRCVERTSTQHRDETSPILHRAHLFEMPCSLGGLQMCHHWASFGKKGLHNTDASMQMHLSVAGN